MQEILVDTEEKANEILGKINTGDVTFEDAAKELFQLVLDVASGKKVKAEIAGFHDLAIFKQGVTL